MGILLVSSFSSLWLLSNGSCTLAGCHHVMITWYNNNMMSDALFIYSFTKIHRYILHLVVYTWSSVMCKSQEISPHIICRYYNIYHRSYTHRYITSIRFILCSCLSAPQVVGVYCLPYLHSLAWLHSLLATCGFQYCRDIFVFVLYTYIYPICNILRKCYRNIQV